MKKIRTITFHAAHNYGSCLQAYALQEFIKKLFSNKCDYKIINFRTTYQKNFYQNVFEKKQLSTKEKIIKCLTYKDKNLYIKRTKRFEEFINNKLQLTKEYTSLEELNTNVFSADYYICGSDQIWNYNSDMSDFDMAYFLPFTDSKNKISYAVSMGPLNSRCHLEREKQIIKELKKFKALSVRDANTAKQVNQLVNREPDINVDPTILLTNDEWDKALPKKSIAPKYDYVFLYHLWNKYASVIANKISKALKMPVVTPVVPREKEYLYNFNKLIDSGPSEFLDLIKNAKYVVSSSFHGCVLSVLYNKPLFIVNNINDNRLNYFMTLFNLQHRNTNIRNYLNVIKTKMDYKYISSIMSLEREKSKKYLCEFLDIQPKS